MDEACNKNAENVAATYLYAEHAYPGKSASDLVHVVALAHLVTPSAAVQLPSYSTMVVPVYVRDGFVAASCGPTSRPQVDTVTFIGP